MSDKISKQLTMAERFILLAILPEPDFVTYKIMRKLKETLSPTEEEIKEYNFQTQFRCQHRDYDEHGKATQCEYVVESKERPNCPIHNEVMKPTGQVSWATEMWGTTKEIWFGVKANEVILEALKHIPKEVKKGNTDIILSICEKFGESLEED